MKYYEAARLCFRKFQDSFAAPNFRESLLLFGGFIANLVVVESGWRRLVKTHAAEEAELSSVSEAPFAASVATRRHHSYDVCLEGFCRREAREQATSVHEGKGL